MLQRYGCAVTTIAGGEEAVEAVRKAGGAPFDLILMDLQVSPRGQGRSSEKARGAYWESEGMTAAEGMLASNGSLLRSPSRSDRAIG
jgi:CheY-like chemotaxis protein